MAPRPDVDPRRQPCQRVGDHVRDRQMGEAEGLAREAVRIGRAGGRDDGRDARIGSRREDRPDGAHRVAGDRRRSVTSGRSRSARKAASVSAPNSPALSGSGSGGLAPLPRTSKVRQWKPGGVQEDRHRQRPVPRRFPAVDEDDAGTGCAAARRDEPGRQRDARRTRSPSTRTAGRGRLASAAAGCGAGSRRGRDTRARSDRRDPSGAATAAAAMPGSADGFPTALS